MSRVSPTWKVIFVCGLSAFIGALIGLQIGHGSAWSMLIGLIAGFPFGYLIYEWRQVVVAVPVAWNASTSWQPDKKWRKAYGRFILAMSSLGTMIAVPFVSAAIYSLYVAATSSHSFTTPLVLAGFLIAVAAIAIVFFTLFGLAMGAGSSIQKLIMDREAFDCRPLQIWFWTLPKGFFYGLPKWVWGHRAVFQSAMRGLGNFLKTYFRLIHSDIRLLCGTDAAIGAAVGCHFHNAVLGAVVGAVLGGLNFELLSIRYFKYVPIEQSILHRAMSR